jgi:uncharacterized membrane protein YccC
MPGPLRAAVTAARHGLRRYARDLRASRAFLASEVSHGGWLDAGQFRWRDATPGRAARAAFGVAVPLALGLATRHVEYGTFAALGAQPAGVVSFQGVTRSRIMLVTVAVAGMAVSTFVGATVASAAPWLMPVVIALWAYAAGVCAALGPTALIVALQWPVAVLIASAVPLGPEPALVRAGLVVAGGLWQAVLVISTWTISRGAAERAAMAASYAALGQYASRLSTDRGVPPPPEALPGTRALRDPNPLMRSDARRHLTDLMVEAERIRTTLTVAAGASAGGGAPGADRAALLAAVAGALDEIAAALRARPADRAGHLAAARAVLGPDPRVAGHAWTWAGESLHGQVRGTIRMAQRLNDAEPVRGSRPPRPAVRPPAHDLLVTLRANLTTSSEAGRHALRLAVVTGLTAVLARALGLAHGYWAVLTALLVLRPDYGSTLYRGVQRAGGTVLGAGVGLAIVLVGRLGPAALVAGVALCMFAAFALLTVNYLFFSVFLTAFVVVELDLLGLPADQTAPDRLIATALGTALALLAFVAWPTWERTTASEKFARLFLAQSRFASLLLRAYTRPDGPDLARARTEKLAARRARSGAEVSADRIADEPERPPVTHDLAQALVSSGHRMALAALAVEAATREEYAALRRDPVPVAAGTAPPAPQPAQPSATAPPDGLQDQLDRFADLVRQSGVQLAEALRRPGPPGPLPPLRELQSALYPAGASGALMVATDGLTDALNTTADVLRQHLGRP